MIILNDVGCTLLIVDHGKSGDGTTTTNDGK